MVILSPLKFSTASVRTSNWLSQSSKMLMQVLKSMLLRTGWERGRSCSFIFSYMIATKKYLKQMFINVFFRKYEVWEIIDL